MRVRSEVAAIPRDRVQAMLNGLPAAPGYRIVVKPLRYREKPHLSAWTDVDHPEIVRQVPHPCFAFGEIVPSAAKRRPGKGMRFIWMTEGVTFQTPREVLRFLYLHEWMHWYLKERLGRGAGAETAWDGVGPCSYRRRRVTERDGDAALIRR